MKLSIVATMYQSAPHLLEFHHRASEAARKLVADDYEIVLVNDGSPDESMKMARQLVARDAHVVVVDLSRNFGHHKAMMTGLAHAKGERIFLIDSDLEEAPEWLLNFAHIMTQRSCDVVYGVQEQRKGSWFERTSGRLFYWLLNRLSGDDLPQNVVTARLMTRRYVNALLLHREREVFIVGLWHLTGFEQVAEIVGKTSSSQTSYTLRKKLSLMVNAITSFSNAPPSLGLQHRRHDFHCRPALHPLSDRELAVLHHATAGLDVGHGVHMAGGWHDHLLHWSGGNLPFEDIQ